MDYQRLADLLFPQITKTPADVEAEFPQRVLPEGAKVTRFAPSPTGFVHFGGLFPTTVAERLAHQSGGVLYLRIEDTDAKREVPGAAEALIRTLSVYGVNFDEGAILGEDGKICDKCKPKIFAFSVGFPPTRRKISKPRWKPRASVAHSFPTARVCVPVWA